MNTYQLKNYYSLTASFADDHYYSTEAERLDKAKAVQSYIERARLKAEAERKEWEEYDRYDQEEG